MRIVQIEIEEFGKLSHCTFAPDHGMNLFQGPNESGKSTLLAFLRFAFYGFPRRSGPEGEECDRRLSWQNRRAAGTLTLEVGGTVYRISRSYTLRGSAKRLQPIEELSVISLPDGTALPCGGRSPGEYFLGLPPELYDSSLCVRQSDLARVTAPGMGETVEQLLFGDGESNGARSAERILENARRVLLHRKGRGGKIPEYEDALAALNESLTRARQEALELEQLRNTTAKLRAQIDAQHAELNEVCATLERADDAQLLIDFAELARARQREQAEQAVLEQAQRDCANELPKDTFFDTVQALLHQCTHEEAQIAQLAPEAETLRKVSAAEPPVHAATAKNGDAVLARYRANRARAKRCACFGGALALLAGGTAVLTRWPSLRASAVIIGVALALAALGCFLAASAASAGNRHTLQRLDLKNGAMLRTHLEQIRADAARSAQLHQRLQELEFQLQSSIQRRDRVLAALADALTDVGFPTKPFSSAEVKPIVEALLQKRALSRERIAKAGVEYERARAAAEALAARLASRDEAAIRARAGAAAGAWQDMEALRARRERLTAQISDLQSAYTEAQRRESALQASIQSPTQLEAEQTRIANAKSEATQRLAALELALTALTEASAELRRNVTPTLARKASSTLRSLTSDAHTTLYLSADFVPAVECAGGVQPLSHFSAGCRDAVHLALRLALLDSIAQERLPLFFDEALSRLDDDRARAVLDVLRAYCREGGQCLLFSCHTREAAWLADDATVFQL